MRGTHARGPGRSVIVRRAWLTASRVSAPLPSRRNRGETGGLPSTRCGVGTKCGVGVAVVEIVARVQVGSGASVEQLVCHPRLSLIAGLDSERPAVHVWDCTAGELHELGTVGTDSTRYGDAIGWKRRKRTPAAVWHPDEPLLLVADEATVARWTPAGVFELDGVPPAAAYRSLAFSPDGRTLWASPSSGADGYAWRASDALDLTSGTVVTGPGWDTGVAAHPAGGLVTTLRSDQGATLAVFARVDQRRVPAAMRVLGRALILDADGYQTPIFSVDGRRVAIRGNAYENSLEVFEFPSLNRELAVTLGEPNPGCYPYSQEWLEQKRAWSRHNVAFAARPGVLWVGTPTGALVEVDLDNQYVVRHDVLAGSPVTALGATAAGELVAAGGSDLALLSVPDGSTQASAVDNGPLQATVTAFLDATFEIPDDGDPETHLVISDGTRSWEPDDLAAVSTASATDPAWLQLQAAINNACDRKK